MLAVDFARALKFPFSPSSQGARVPDPYGFPTATYHLHGTTVCSNASGCVAFFPNPVFSMVALSGTVTSSMSQYTNSTFVYGASTTANLFAVLSDFRVVSWGIKISNLQPELSATGRFIIAQIPCTDTIPPGAILGSQATTVDNLSTTTLGAAASVVGSAALLALPSAIELAAQDVLHGDLEIAGQYTSAQFFSFKQSEDTAAYNTNARLVDAFEYNSSTGAIVVGSLKDPSRCVGGASTVIYWEGCGATPCFQVEYVYHLEGSPQLSSSTKITPVASVPPQACVGTTTAVEAGMSATTGNKAFNWIDKGLDFINNADATVRNVTGQGLTGWAASIMAML